MKTRILVLLSILITTTVTASRLQTDRQPPDVSDQGVVPLKITEPRWPRRALINGLDGWVLLEMKLQDNGKPKDLKVVDSTPGTLFNKAALKAASRWIFEVPDDNTEDETYQYLMEFRIDRKPYKPGHFAKLSLSKATIANSSISEMTKKTISMSFDYEITPYSDLSAVYQCKIFFLAGNQTIPSDVGINRPCDIDKATGQGKVTSVIPDQKDIPEGTEKLNFVIAIMQKRSEGKVQVIGTSNVFQLAL